MKDLTIEQKARAYDQAIERANELLYVSDKDSLQYKTIESIFPELKESEDQKIKKSFVRLIKSFHDVNFPTPENFTRKDMLDWLEKQGEQKPIEIIPKFNVGDWITDGDIVGQVISVNEEYYHYICNGFEQPLYILNAHKYHIWTIQDAKPGDVLSYRDGQWIFIYKGIVTEDTFKYYALLSEKGITVNDAAFSLLSSCITPATKEQRDTLMKAMADAGYAWDTKNKQLIEQESTWNEKIKGLNELETYILSLVPNRSLDAIKVDAKSIRYIINKEQNSAWSEEDEDAIGMAIIALEDMYDPESPNDTYAGYTMPFNRAALRLRYLKDRGLPKNEWSEEDEEMVQVAIDACKSYQESLLSDSRFDKAVKAGDWLKSLKDRVQFKRYWSEKDEEIHKKCICAMRASACGFPEEEKFVEQVDNWFKSLKDRIQPQIKQEWSEEDESILNGILDCYKSMDIKWRNWLKSLKPQNRWKPSDEQMKFLQKCIKAYNEVTFPTEVRVLSSLYNDLKKL